MDTTNLKTTNITFIYEIFNLGPSTISNSILELSIPSNFSGLYQIISPNDVTVSGEYESRVLESTWQKAEMEISFNDKNDLFFEHNRTRRSYNRYTRQIIDSYPATVTPNQPPLIGSSIFEILPSNRTTYFNCTHGNHDCIKISFIIKDFLKSVGSRLVRIVVNVTLNEEKLC